MMREIHTDEIVTAVQKLCIDANFYLPCSLEEEIKTQSLRETSPLCRSVFCDMLYNLKAASDLQLPICQDTGMAVVFAEIGQQVHIVGGDFTQAINRGVKSGYLQGELRMSIVSDPIERKNTQDNTPAFLHVNLVPGDRLKLTVAPKGAGSENMSAMKMFTPSATEHDIINFVCDTVKKASGNSCPPLVIGVGIGGDFEIAPLLAKRALCRDVSLRHCQARYEALEQDMLDAVNRTGVGAQGFGGDVTALCVNIETFATHIACLPVAVNLGCHVTRHKTVIL